MGCRVRIPSVDLIHSGKFTEVFVWLEKEPYARRVINSDGYYVFSLMSDEDADYLETLVYGYKS